MACFRRNLNTASRGKVIDQRRVGLLICVDYRDQCYFDHGGGIRLFAGSDCWLCVLPETCNATAAPSISSSADASSSPEAVCVCAPEAMCVCVLGRWGKGL